MRLTHRALENIKPDLLGTSDDLSRKMGSI